MFTCLLDRDIFTQGEFLARIRGQGEAEHGHGGDEDARHDQVEEVVEGPPPVTANHSSVFQLLANHRSASKLWANESSPDLDDEGDVQVRFRATVVDDLVSLCWYT